MASDGPDLIPMLMGTPYANYPPLYFWLSWLFPLPAGRVTPLSAVRDFANWENQLSAPAFLDNNGAKGYVFAKY